MEQLLQKQDFRAEISYAKQDSCGHDALSIMQGLQSTPHRTVHRPDNPQAIPMVAHGREQHLAKHSQQSSPV